MGQYSYRVETETRYPRAMLLEVIAATPEETQPDLGWDSCWLRAIREQDTGLMDALLEKGFHPSSRQECLVKMASSFKQDQQPMWREYARQLMGLPAMEMTLQKWAMLARDHDLYAKVVRPAEVDAMFSVDMPCDDAMMALTVLERQAKTENREAEMKTWRLEAEIARFQSHKFKHEPSQQRYEAQVQRTLAALIQLGVPCDGPSLKPADYERYKAQYKAAGHADQFTPKPKKKWWPFGGHATVAPEPT